MLWFERPLLAVLHHEYGAAMRFTEDESAEVMPIAPAGPCQLYVHIPFCEVLCPFCSFHRVRYQDSKSHRYFRALRDEIRLYHAAGFRFSDLYVGGGTPTVDADELLETLELVRSLVASALRFNRDESQSPRRRGARAISRSRRDAALGRCAEFRRWPAAPAWTASRNTAAER